MKKYRKNSFKNKPFTKKEKIGWLLVSIVFTICFIYYFTISYISNCIFEWPIRWDIKKCWNEQIIPARDRASEKAVNFVP